MIELRGITWDHVRGIAPLISTSKEFQQKHPHITITWDKRSLKKFEDYPVERLVDQYDLIMLDHPSIGENVEKEIIIPLDHWVPSSVLEEQKENSVGPSYQSYSWAGHQWALAADASAQVSAYRDDLLKKFDLTVPKTWEEVFQLISNLPDSIKIGIPLHPTHAFCSFYTLYCNLTETTEIRVIDLELAEEVLANLAILCEQAHPDVRFGNPIHVLDQMGSTDEIAYVPLIFGYMNYSLANFRPHLIHFTDIPSYHAKPVGSVLGGVGIAISSKSKHVEEAIKYAVYVVGEQTQRRTYFTSGGQPGHLQAWRDPTINREANDYFTSTLATMKHASMRPRERGAIRLQEQAGQHIYAYLNRWKNRRETAQLLVQLFDKHDSGRHNTKRFAK